MSDAAVFTGRDLQNAVPARSCGMMSGGSAGNADLIPEDTMAKSTTNAAPKAASKAQANDSDTSGGKIAKTEIIDMVGAQAGLTKKQASEAVNAALDVIVSALKDGKTVGLPGIGTLSVRATAARTGVRPGTNERISIPEGKKVAFKVATDLKSGL